MPQIRSRPHIALTVLAACLGAAGALELAASFAPAAQAQARPKKRAPRRRPAAKPTLAVAPSPPDLAAEAALLKEFSDRVAKYVELHKRLKDGAPKLKARAEAVEIQRHQEAMAQAIQSARAGAAPGDLFAPAVQAVFRRILKTELAGPGSAPARKAVKEGNPKVEAPAKPVALKVNAAYPRDASVSTVPPTILLKLPRLPDEVLEYRFVGRDLIVRDVAANVIIDFMREAVP